VFNLQDNFTRTVISMWISRVILITLCGQLIHNSWRSSNPIHSILMSIFYYIFTEAILQSRNLKENPEELKYLYLHLIFHSLGFVLCTIGWAWIFFSRNIHYTSWHSIVGFFALLLHTLVYSIGFAYHFKWTMSIRLNIWHQILGVFSLIFNSIAVCFSFSFVFTNLASNVWIFLSIVQLILVLSLILQKGHVDLFSLSIMSREQRLLEDGVISLGNYNFDVIKSESVRERGIVKSLLSVICKK
jgi:hypothetical protein